MATSKTRLSRFQPSTTTYGWSGVQPEAYKQGHDQGREWEGIARQVLIGNQDEEIQFHLRYFEVAPKGYSSLEKHGHAHVVVAVRGQGRAVLGDRTEELRPFDSVYVAPWTPHQFFALDEEPFGFFCIVDADRDRPQPVSQEEYEQAVRAGALSPVRPVSDT